jgi:hypothetical protein
VAKTLVKRRSEQLSMLLHLSPHPLHGLLQIV